MDSDIIQNKEVIPDTHIFVYNNKEYPFKFDYFKYASKYFSTNQKELEDVKKIQLLGKDESNIITEDSLVKFINFVQGKKIKIDNENVICLNFLSHKYEVQMLEEKTRKFIENHQDELVLKILNEKQNEINFDSEMYEKIISNNLNKYIDDPLLLSINIPILYRILQQYLKQSKSTENEQLNEFLIKCVDKYGQKASVLFENISFGKTNLKYVNLLINKYSDKIDFQYLASNIILALKERENELRLNKEKHDATISSKENEINELKQQISNHEMNNRNLQRTIEQKEQYLNEIELQKNDIEKTIIEKESEIKKIKQQNTEICEKNSKHEQTIKELQKQIEQDKNKYLKEIEEQKQNEMKLNEEVKILNQKIKQYQEIHLFYKEEEKLKFNGIINYLKKLTGGNIHENGTIEITSSPHRENRGPENLLNFNINNRFTPKQDNNSWVCYDFKNNKVKITNYLIKSNITDSNAGHLRGWVIEISNDGETWTTIDEQKNCSILNGSGFIGVFTAQQNDFSRYVRLRQTEKSWGGDYYWTSIHFIEFYGYLSKLN